MLTGFYRLIMSEVVSVVTFLDPPKPCTPEQTLPGHPRAITLH
jgi:hypothetical protein